MQTFMQLGKVVPGLETGRSLYFRPFAGPWKSLEASEPYTRNNFVVILLD